MNPRLLLRRLAGLASLRLIEHAKRHRVVVALIAVSVGWKLLLIGVGGMMPRFLITNGLTDVPVEMRPYGIEAISTARALWGGPIERHSVRGVRLVSIERRQGPSAAACGGLTARVRAYTFFAIPYSEVRTICDRGTVEYRMLPHCLRER